MEYTGKDVAKMVEMTAKGLGYYINLVDKASVWEKSLQFWKKFYCW